MLKRERFPADGRGGGATTALNPDKAALTMRVVVIDDSTIDAGVARLALQQLDDAVVLESHNAATALELSEDFEPDLMLVDWTMPELSGRSLIETYREAGGAARIIVMAQESERPEMIEAFRAGANHYVFKPFAPATLLRCINRVMSRDR